ncbi:MAG: carbon storage regulator CsrA [Planctomycetota bacterium]|nr:carbon storage regulator CsrA [Planctomycetota bacterium]MDA1162043.1 carbon storage regulator CsrA [Planctomycetota bacterium]
MLVLSRKKNEKIIINESIVITVVDVRGDRVRIGIEAPRDIPIHRQEIHDAIEKALTQQESPERSE